MGRAREGSGTGGFLLPLSELVARGAPRTRTSQRRRRAGAGPGRSLQAPPPPLPPGRSGGSDSGPRPGLRTVLPHPPAPGRIPPPLRRREQLPPRPYLRGRGPILTPSQLQPLAERDAARTPPPHPPRLLAPGPAPRASALQSSGRGPLGHLMRATHDSIPLASASPSPSILKPHLSPPIAPGPRGSIGRGTARKLSPPWRPRLPISTLGTRFHSP